MHSWSYLWISLFDSKTGYVTKPPISPNGDAKREAMAIKEFVEDFAAGVSATGMTLVGAPTRPKMLPIEDGNFQLLNTTLKNAANANLELLLIVLPTDDKVLYGHIKYLADKVSGIHVTCIIGSKEKALRNRESRPQYFANVAMKINSRFDGVNHTLAKGQMPVIEAGDTIVVGVDVTHPPSNSKPEVPSIAAMTASLDGRLGLWPAVVRMQKTPKDEMVNEIGDMLLTRLQPLDLEGRQQKVASKYTCLSRRCIGGTDSTRLCQRIPQDGPGLQSTLRG